MPFDIKSLGGGRFKVVNKATGNVHSKSTTPAKAKAQIRAMHANEKASSRVRTTREATSKHPHVGPSHNSKHKSKRKARRS